MPAHQLGGLFCAHLLGNCYPLGGGNGEPVGILWGKVVEKGVKGSKVGN